MSKTILILYFAFISSYILYAEKLKITLAYADTEFYPYQIANSQSLSDPPGIAVEIIKEAVERSNMEVEFLRYPNHRVLVYLKNNMIDGAFLYSYKPDRLSYGCFPMTKEKIDTSKRITSSSYFLYKKKDNPINWDGKKFYNINKAIIGADLGYSIVADLREKGIIIEESKTSEQNLMKLKFGRIDAYAAQDNTTDFKIKNGQYGDIVKIPKFLSKKDYYLMLSKGFLKEHPKEAEIIWTNIEKVREEQIHKLHIKYSNLRKDKN